MEFIVWADDRETDARKVKAADMAAAIEAACRMFGVEADEVNIINAESVNGGPNVGEAEYYGVSHAF